MSDGDKVVRDRWRLGAIPTPRHKLLAVTPFKPLRAAPQQVVWLADRYDPWGNDQYGDCVSAEEAWAKAVYGTKPFLPGQTVIDWARRHGVLNGAMLPDVMDAMARDGFTAGPQQYNDGPYKGVDYSNESVLQAALTVGPVKIGIDHSALPDGAGNQQGWVGTGGRPGQYGNTDHCVGIAGFGPASYLFDQLKLPLPSQLRPDQQGYLLYTWATVGFVDHAWIMSTCSEAWIRTPTTVGVPPLPEPTPPTPPPPPVPTPPTPPAPPGPGPSPGWITLLVMLLPIIIQVVQQLLPLLQKEYGPRQGQGPQEAGQGMPGYQEGHARQPSPPPGQQAG